MKIEYEEFENVGDLFLYLVSAAPPMKNTMPITVYKGNVMSFIPLSCESDCGPVYKRGFEIWNIRICRTYQFVILHATRNISKDLKCSGKCG